MDIDAFPINELHHVDSVNQAQVWVFVFLVGVVLVFFFDSILVLQSQMAVLGFQIS